MRRVRVVWVSVAARGGVKVKGGGKGGRLPTLNKMNFAMQFDMLLLVLYVPPPRPRQGVVGR